MEIQFVRNGLPGVTKQPTIVKVDGNTLYPIVYFTKPKNASQKDFDAAVDFLILQAEKTMKQ